MIYLAAALRNAGNGVAVLHGWYPSVDWQLAPQTHAPVEQFRRLTRDLHIPAGDVGFWQGAIRDPGDPYPRSSSPRSQRTTDPPSTSSTATTRAASVPSLASPSHRSKTAICSTSSRYWNLDQRDPR